MPSTVTIRVVSADGDFVAHVVRENGHGTGRHRSARGHTISEAIGNLVQMYPGWCRIDLKVDSEADRDQFYQAQTQSQGHTKEKEANRG